MSFLNKHDSDFLGQFFYSQGGSVLDSLVYIFLLQKELWVKAPTSFPNSLQKNKNKKAYL